jgi:hypothetical protein
MSLSHTSYPSLGNLLLWGCLSAVYSGQFEACSALSAVNCALSVVLSALEWLLTWSTQYSRGPAHPAAAAATLSAVCRVCEPEKPRADAEDTSFTREQPQ